MNEQENWKNALLTMDDNSFFDLMRNYLGKRPSPFNKHRMIEDLSAFLSQPETLDAIASRLDTLDKKLLSLVILLKKAPGETLTGFFEPEYRPWELRQRLVNLRERLIIYKDHQGSYSLVPVLAETLTTFLPDAWLLFSCVPAEEQAPDLWLNDGFLTALLSYSIHYAPKGTKIKKPGLKGLKDFHAVFPALKNSPEKTVLIVDRLMQWEIFSLGEAMPREVFQEWRTLQDMGEKQRLLFLWNRLLWQKTALPDRTQALPENFLPAFITFLPPGTAFSQTVLEKIIRLILRDFSEAAEMPADIPAVLRALNILADSPQGLVINSLLKTPEWLPHGTKPETTQGEPPPGESSPGGFISLQPNMELTIPPRVDLEEIFPLAFYFQIQRHEQLSLYLLNQESFYRGIQAEKWLPPLRPLLSKLSGRALPQNIDFSLSHWEKQYRGLRLMEGLVLKTETWVAGILEKHPRFSPFIREILAPGVYLLDPRQKEDWEKALMATGIFALPPVESFAETGPAPEGSFMKPPRVPQTAWLAPLETIRFTEPAASDLLPGEIQPGEPAENPLKEALEELAKTGDFHPEEWEEIKERLGQKLILFPGQINHEYISKEQKEASGLDYKGKVRLIEDVLSKGNEYLEISWFGPEDELLTEAVIPRSLAKEETELVLSGPYLRDPEGRPFSIRVRKLSRIKRKKLSFFFSETT